MSPVAHVHRGRKDALRAANHDALARAWFVVAIALLLQFANTGPVGQCLFVFGMGFPLNSTNKGAWFPMATELLRLKHLSRKQTDWPGGMAAPLCKAFSGGFLP